MGGERGRMMTITMMVMEERPDSCTIYSSTVPP